MIVFKYNTSMITYMAQNPRRKILLGLIPYLIQLLGQVENIVRPDFNLQSYSEENIDEILKSLKRRVSVTKFDDRVDVTLDRELFHDLLTEYLRVKYSAEGGLAITLEECDRETKNIQFMWVVKTPNRYVYITVLDKVVDNIPYQELAEELAPNHILFLTLSGEYRVHRSGPRFVGVNKVLVGEVMLLPMSNLLEEVTNIRNASNFMFSEDGLKFSLTIQDQ